MWPKRVETQASYVRYLTPIPLKKKRERAAIYIPQLGAGNSKVFCWSKIKELVLKTGVKTAKTFKLNGTKNKKNMICSFRKKTLQFHLHVGVSFLFPVRFQHHLLRALFPRLVSEKRRLISLEKREEEDGPAITKKRSKRSPRYCPQIDLSENISSVFVGKEEART